MQFYLNFKVQEILKSTEDHILPYCYNEVEWINEGNTEKPKQYTEIVFGERKGSFSPVCMEKEL